MAAIGVKRYRLGEGCLLLEELDVRGVLHLEQLARQEDEEGADVADDDAKHDEVDQRLGLAVDEDFFLVVVEVAFELVELLVDDKGDGTADVGLEEVGQQVHRGAQLHADEDAAVGCSEGADHAAGRRCDE
jgi:hypothetical protein